MLIVVLHSKSVYLSPLKFKRNGMTAIVPFLLRLFLSKWKKVALCGDLVTSFCHLVSVTNTMYCLLKCCLFAQIIVTGEKVMQSLFGSRDEAAYMRKTCCTDQTCTLLPCKWSVYYQSFLFTNWCTSELC